MYNFATVVDRNAERDPDAMAVRSAERRLTHRDLYEEVNALACGLSELGVVYGDVVAVALYNCPEFVTTAFAVNRLGAAFLPLNCRLSPEEWRYILEHSTATAVVAEAEFESAIDIVLASASDVQRISLARQVRKPWRSLPALIAENKGAKIAVHDVVADDLHRLIYTSGTTSRPKGVPVSHENLAWKNFSHIVEFGLTAADATLVCGPMYHVGGFDLPGVGTLHAGGSLAILSKFDARDTLMWIRDEPVTNVWLAPTMLNAILRVPDLDDFDTSSIRFIVTGGEKMPEPLISGVMSAFPNAWFADAYGLSETVSGDTINDRKHALTKAGSVGRAVAHLQVKIVGSDGNPVCAEETGEIALRGPKVVNGYWRDKEATDNAFREGWFYTGDVGRIDGDGYLFVEDRKKDMIVSGGENIATPEIERVLYDHPEIIEASVVGKEDKRWGEVPHAFVVVSSTEANEENIQEYCRRHLAKFKVPAAITILESLPRTASGKVLKRDLTIY